MWLTILKLILPFITGNISALLTDFVKGRRELKIRQLECDTQIALANIESTNSQSVKDSEMQKLLTEHKMDIQKIISKKSGNRFVDAANTLVRTITTYWYIIILYPIACWYYRSDTIILNSVITTVDYIISFWFTNRSLNKK